MARHFTVTLTSGTNVGPYDIYYDQINSNNFAKLYGTTTNADDLTLSEVQNGVLVTVPNEASTILLYNTNVAFGTDCPTTTITYNIPGQPVPTATATPVPTSTPVPPTATPVPPTATPVPPTATPVPPTATATPLPTQTPPPPPPTATPNTPTATPVTPTATPIPPPPTETPTPTPSATPTATPVLTCTEYQITYPSSASNPTGTWTFTCCDGSPGSVTLGRDQDGIICVQDGTTVSTPQGGISPQEIGSCTSGCGDGAQPTATPTATPVPPTPTPVGQCEFVFVPDNVSWDTTRYGLRWNNPQTGIETGIFNAMLGSPTTYGGENGVVFGVCSTVLPLGWDSVDNTALILDGMINLPAGGQCQSNNACIWEGATPVPTPTPQPTPTTVPVITCTEYDINYPSNASNTTGTWSYTCCDGSSGSVTLSRDQSGTICVQDGTTITTPQGGSTDITPYECTGCDGTIITPTATPQPTATSIPTGGCIEYSYSDSGSLGDPDRSLSYTDCNGQTQSFSFPAGGYGSICVQQGTTIFNSPTTEMTLEGDCASGSTVTPTATPAPTAIQPTEVPRETLYRFQYCGGHISDSPTAGDLLTYSQSTLQSNGMTTATPQAGDTITLSGSGNAGAFWEYISTGGLSESLYTIQGFNDGLCPGPNV